MGFEAEKKVRSEVFKPYQVNPQIDGARRPRFSFMHACLRIAVTK